MKAGLASFSMSFKFLQLLTYRMAEHIVAVPGLERYNESVQGVQT